MRERERERRRASQSTSTGQSLDDHRPQVRKHPKQHPTITNNMKTRNHKLIRRKWLDLPRFRFKLVSFLCLLMAATTTTLDYSVVATNQSHATQQVHQSTQRPHTSRIFEIKAQANGKLLFRKPYFAQRISGALTTTTTSTSTTTTTQKPDLSSTTTTTLESLETTSFGVRTPKKYQLVEDYTSPGEHESSISASSPMLKLTTPVHKSSLGAAVSGADASAFVSAKVRTLQDSIDFAPETIAASSSDLNSSILSLIDEFDSKMTTNKSKASLSCDSGEMVLRLNFSEPFRGVVYPDHNRLSPCRFFGDGHLNYELRLPLRGCGTQQAAPRVFVNDVVVRFHKSLELEEDEVKTLICRYPPPTTATVSSPTTASSTTLPQQGNRNMQEVVTEANGQFELIENSRNQWRHPPSHNSNSNIETLSENIIVAPSHGLTNQQHQTHLDLTAANYFNNAGGQSPQSPPQTNAKIRQNDLFHQRSSSSITTQPQNELLPNEQQPTASSTSSYFERLSSVELLFMISSLMFLVLLALSLAAGYLCVRRRRHLQAQRNRRNRRLHQAALVEQVVAEQQHHHSSRASAILRRAGRTRRRPQTAALLAGSGAGAGHFYADHPQVNSHRQRCYLTTSSPESDLDNLVAVSDQQQQPQRNYHVNHAYTQHEHQLGPVLGRRDATGGALHYAAVPPVPPVRPAPRPKPQRLDVTQMGTDYRQAPLLKTSAHFYPAQAWNIAEAHRKPRMHVPRTDSPPLAPPTQIYRARSLSAVNQSDNEGTFDQQSYAPNVATLERRPQQRRQNFIAWHGADKQKQQPKLMLKSIQDSYITNYTEIYEQEYKARDTLKPLSLAQWRLMQPGKEKDNQSTSSSTSTTTEGNGDAGAGDKSPEPEQAETSQTNTAGQTNFRSLSELDVATCVLEAPPDGGNKQTQKEQAADLVLSPEYDFTRLELARPESTDSQKHNSVSYV